MREGQVPEHLLANPKNKAQLAIARLGLPKDDSMRVLVMSSIPAAPVFIEVAGRAEACEVSIEDDDTVDHLAWKVERAVRMVRDADLRSLSGRHWWADQRPDACHEVADPTIRLSTAEPLSHVWSLPAGWAPLVNRLHRDLQELLGDYEVTLVGQKAGGLRFYTTPIARGKATERIEAAREESWRICEVCGGPGERSKFSTRCPAHDRSQGITAHIAVARPPGWVPPRGRSRRRE